MLGVSHSLTGGGAERFMATLLSNLDGSRFVAAVCLATDRMTYPLPDHVPVSVLGYRRLRDLPRTILRLRRAIAAQRPDVVLSNVLSTNCIAGAALWRLRPRPSWVARIGNAPGISEPLLHRWWARLVYPRARVLVGNSREMLPALRRRYSAPGVRVVALPNPTDFARLDRLAQEPPARRSSGEGATLIWVGRLTRQKRVDLLLKALAEVRRATDARLWLCGEGPLRRRVERWVAELGLAEAVEILGFCPNPFSLMRQADLFVSSSDFEGLPNALIEAQGLGLPAVATRCPFGPEEIIEDRVTGRLVEVGDVRGLAEAVLRMVRDAPGRARMGAAASRRARSLYDVAVVQPLWEGLLREASEIS